VVGKVVLQLAVNVALSGTFVHPVTVGCEKVKLTVPVGATVPGEAKVAWITTGCVAGLTDGVAEANERLVEALPTTCITVEETEGGKFVSPR
jgi:hypothetical protein